MQDGKLRSRRWFITINNYDEQDIENYNELRGKLVYGILGKEIGASGTQHIHIGLHFRNAHTFSSLKRTWPRANIQVAKGDDNDMKRYISKTGTQVEHGQPSVQGERTDLMKEAEAVKKGISVEDVAWEKPQVYHSYGRTLEKLEAIRMRSLYRTEPTIGIWYYGPTGTGKSMMAFAGFNPKTHYVWNQADKFQCGYAATHETVIMDDFRGSIPYGELLRIMDRYPYEVNQKYKAPMPFMAKTLIITSSLRPCEIYTKLAAKDSFEQLYRRCHMVEMTQKCPEGNTDPLCTDTGGLGYASPPSPAEIERQVAIDNEMRKERLRSTKVDIDDHDF